MADGRTTRAPVDLSHIGQIFRARPTRQDSNDLLRKVLDAAIEVAGADKATLQRLDDENGRLQIVATRGFSDELLR